MARQKNRVIKRLLDPTSAEDLKALEAWLGRAIQKADALDDSFLKTLAGEVQSVALDPMIQQLRAYPPRKPGMKMRWSSLRQKRYVLMKLRKENNLPYQRTGDLAAGWRAVALVAPRAGSIRLETENTATARDLNGRVYRYQRYVTGDIGLGESLRSFARYQQPIQAFHTDRGWQPAFPIIQAYYIRAEAYVFDRIAGKFDETVEE